MYCERCGTWNDGGNFCPSCGADLREQGMMDTMPPDTAPAFTDTLRQAPPSQPPTSPAPQKSLPFMVAVGVCTCLAIFCVALVVRTGSSSPSSEAGKQDEQQGVSAPIETETPEESELEAQDDNIEPIEIQAPSATEPQPEFEPAPEADAEPEPVTPVATATPVDQPAASPADTFPRLWQGWYLGTSGYISDQVGNISRGVVFHITSVDASGNFSGICYVGRDTAGLGETYGTYNIAGSVDWSTGAINFQGTSWIDQGGMGRLRVYTGTVDFGAGTMGGNAWDLGTGNYNTAWNVSAVNQAYLVQYDDASGYGPGAISLP